MVGRAHTSGHGARSTLSAALWLSVIGAALWLSAIGAIVAATLVAAPSGKPVTHTIVMEGTSFEPVALTVTLGDSVVWVNKDFFPHTATAEGVFDSSIIPAGTSWTYTPASKGDIEYVCTLHPTMKGTLRVN